MADSSFGSSSDTISLRQISYSLFHTSRSRLGSSAKGSPDSESLWSPTSPLDCKLFSNLSNPFSLKSSRTSFQNGQKKQFDCRNVGLGFISSLVNETKLNGDINSEILGISQRKTIICRPQVKAAIPNLSKNSKSYSLPKNYVISLPSETKNTKSEVVSLDDVSRDEKFNWVSEASKSTISSLRYSTWPSSSLINSNENSSSGINDFCVENISTVMSLPQVTGKSSPEDYSSKIKSSSLPISIDFSNGYIGSLSAREIELSEDYTCIISHGPNPKRTHIFGDCVLVCHKNDLTLFSKKEEPASFKSSQVSTFSEGSVPYPSDNAMSFCDSCK